MLKFNKKSEQAIEAEYLDGFIVSIFYLSRAELRRTLERCKVRKWDKETHQPVDEYDDTRFAKELSKKIKIWRGLTGKVLRKMVDLEEYPPDEEEVPFSQDTAEGLLLNAYDFDKWLQHIASRVDLFDEMRRAEQKKNLSESQNGELPPGEETADEN